MEYFRGTDSPGYPPIISSIHYTRPHCHISYRKSWAADILILVAYSIPVLRTVLSQSILPYPDHCLLLLAAVVGPRNPLARRRRQSWYDDVGRRVDDRPPLQFKY